MHRPDTSANPARRRQLAGLLSGCALVLVPAALPQAAAAQAFAGTPTVVSGTPTLLDGAGVTTITLNDAETIINWKPTDTAGSGTIDFLPNGNFALFTGVTPYTVLNRVLPVDTKGNPSARMVGLNGRIDSTVGRFQSGNVWFYTPTGFVIGPSATINVGGLILTTNDILFGPGNTGGSELYGPGNKVLFRGPVGSTGLVDVQASNPGAGITAASYVALVAPRVQQGGSVTANGPVGYIGAEQVDLTINAGLFDISILAGTNDPNGVVHTGTTTGPASTSAADQQQIIMVAMPKASALTMLLSGSIGYTPAALAANEGSSVILSAGYATPLPTAESTTALGTISMDNASFQNATSAYATNDIDVTAATGPVIFRGDTSLFAQHKIDFPLGTGDTVIGLGDLSLLAGRDGAGGTIDITLGTKAQVNVTGALRLEASSLAIPYVSALPPDAAGGAITVDANGGSLSAATLFADTGATGHFGGLFGGIATAGTISLTARNGGSIAANDLTARADAQGGDSDNTGGSATAGSLSLIGQGGGLNFATILLEARAFGGTGAVVSGAGNGGKAGITLTGGNYNWNSLDVDTGAVSSFDSGTAGAQGNSATGRADAISLLLLGGANLAVAGDINLSSNATATVNGAGSSALGGTILTSVGAGSSLSFAGFSAASNGDVAYPSLLAAAPVSTPDTTGGTVSFLVDGNVTGSALTLSADASAIGASAAAGRAKGGTVAASVNAGGNLTLDDGSGASVLNLHANGFGALGQSAARALGGSATLTVADSTVDVNGTINVAAGGRANDTAFFRPSGASPAGFDATGGSATVQLLQGAAGTANVTANGLFVDAGADASTPSFFYPGGEFGPAGTYGGPFAANGGTGMGGTATLSVAGGNLSSTNVSVSAAGSGGISAASGGATPFRSGDGVGGTAILTVAGGVSSITDLTVSANGVGGGGSAPAGAGQLASLAGDGFGGNARLTISGGTLQTNSLTPPSNGSGGDGSGHSAGGAATDGGQGTGGTARLVSPFGGTGQLTVPSLSILANGSGGFGGTSAGGTNGSGGNGIGGTAETQLADGAFTLGPLTLDADGVGGDGEAGGEGSGGTARFVLDDSAVGASGARTLDGLQLFAGGSGGFGAGGIAQSHSGLAQLTVNAAAPVTINGDLGVSVGGSQSAAGDGFTASFGGEALQVTGNTAVFTTRDATINSADQLQTAGNLEITARKLTATGTLGAGGSVTLSGDQGISLRSVSSGGATSLQSANGAITVTDDLASAGDVTAAGRSLDISSFGSVSFADARATGGSLQVFATGNLSFAQASATGAIGLQSATGSVTATGPVTAGGSVNIVAAAGLTFGSLTSGGATGIDGGMGAVKVTNLLSAGAVGGLGDSIDIASSGALNFGSFGATNGVHIATVGNLTVSGDGGASGDVDLSSSAGAFTSTGTISPGGNLTLSGNLGVTAHSLSAGGTIDLTAANGAVSVANLSTPGAVTAAGRSIDLFSVGQLTMASATATAGDLKLNALELTATGPMSATGNVAIDSSIGISVGTLSAGGTIRLTTGGAVVATNLLSGGDVTATGLSIDIASSGGLTFADAQTTAGALNVATQGDLALNNASAIGHVDLSSANGTVSGSGSINAGGGFTASGRNGLAFATLASGATTSLASSNGTVGATGLSSAGLVTAVGQAVTLNGTGALSFADAQATAGNLVITTPGNLSLAQASATGTIGMTSSAGSLAATGPITAGGAVNLFGSTGLSLGTLTSGGSTLINGGTGALRVTSLTSPGTVTALGGSLDITSPGALTFTSIGATGGAATISTVDNLAVGDGNASGALTLASANGAIGSTGTLTAGGAVSVDGKTGVGLKGLNSGGPTQLTASAGDISVTSLAAAGAITATGRNISIGSSSVLAFDTATATAGDLSLQAQGLSASGLLSATGDVSLDGSNGLSLASVTAGGLTSLRADNGAIGITDLRSTGLVQAFGRSIDISSAAGLSFEDAVASAGGLTIETQLGITAGHASATGDLSLRSLAGTVHTTGAVDGGTISLVADGDVLADFDLTAAGSLGVTAGGVFGLGGTARGTSITVTSNDIQLAGGSRLGVRGTTRDIVLANGDAALVSHIGGAGGAGDYELDSAEAARLFADNSITLEASGDVSVGALQLSYGGAGNIGGGGLLEVTTPGSVEVSGAIDLTTSSAGDRFAIDPTRIDVIAGEGSIAMHSGAAVAQGILDLSADTVTVLTRSTRDTVNGLTDLAQISALLDAPATPGPAGGYLQAGTIRVAARDAFLVQNGGTTSAFADRRGFTADTLTITTGSAATQIAINGTIVRNGTPVNGLATTPLVTINGKGAAAGGQFDALSTINGCVIGRDCAAPPVPRDQLIPPASDDLTPPVSPDNSGMGGLSGTLVQLEDNEPLIAPPLLDEPITGVGNDDLWVPQCDPKQEGCPQQATDK
jgi:filamentous hemagglutinin family protein